MTGLLPLTLGVAMTLALAGYRFGESNHAVYLLDALRHNDPNLLANDWWTRSTLQYHVAFTHVSAWLMRVGMIEPAFLAGYLALAVLLHIVWREITFSLGGDDETYLVSAILYHLAAGGVGLGMYHFLQDSSLLPSNIANVAMLWGVYFWIRGKPLASGACLGMAGLFHLNYALAGIGLWIGLAILSFRRTRFDARWWIGSTLLLALSAPAIAPAVQALLHKTAGLPLNEFVALYVRLRHSHHYDPSSWPIGLWVAFILPLVVAIPAYRIAMREQATSERRRAAEAFTLFVATQCLALLGAGIWYVSEPLIQMSLYRFSIFPKLMSCIAVAWLLWRTRAAKTALRSLLILGLVGLTFFASSDGFIGANALPLWFFTLLAVVALLRPRVDGWGRTLFGGLTSACVVVSLILSWPKLGLVHPGSRGDDAEYHTLCAWARDHTPADAVFLAPPDEQSFRLHARRAIVVNFKNVPQLGSELGEWRDRLQNVLQIDHLRTELPTPFHRALDEMRSRYAALNGSHLKAMANKYKARYVITIRPLAPHELGEPVFSDVGGKYFLYDLAQSPSP